MLFDSNFPEREQLPRTITATFTSYGRLAIVNINGRIADRPLSDHSIVEDFYRYHDVFHIAYATFLGWSPCLRAILRCKRLSNVSVAEIEDGARSRILEEAISLMVFDHARNRNYFRNAEPISRSLLSQIQSLVAGREVADLHSELWESCIASSFAIWNRLRADKEGTIYSNLHRHTMSYVSGAPLLLSA